MEKQEIAKIKKELPRGSYAILARMMKGRYKADTIKAMLNGQRTMKPAVLETVRRFLETIN